MEVLSTKAENLAEKAEALPAFSGLKLSHIKKQLAILLGMIGRDGIFDEYTQHDITHINKMLEMLDWLVPDETKAIMSSSDWLMTVLSIYLHDLGMLVTKREYEQRESSGFPEFKDKDLFAGDKGKDYRAKVARLGPDRAERFAYQEFVRHKHAERIRAWITGQEREHLGISHEVLSELDKLLAPLSAQFRRDLAIICESHHLNDLDDFKKYKTSQPYGDSDEETANLQYAGVLMRTADLLHLTNDRTLSISYRVINPTDPISQDEWAKHMAVRRVRPKLGRDRDGNPSDTAAQDTIEVHADFKSEDGFFGLTSYLQYAREQLQKSYDWVLEANKTQGVKHKFPWRDIDDTHIETEGFIKEAFEFTFDQGRILDLLTGHTLYNDIKIVLRELVQNSIDAVRLQHLIDSHSFSRAPVGVVTIHWDTAQRILTVEDTGTGMTQAIIERNLLKVGASRYQSEEFKNEYPSFSSISRFGIGILSTFMIADSVEILTCHPSEERARQLSLRSVHGKYLIRLIDKYTDQTVKTLIPHGTKIRLRVRHSVDMSDVVETARRWIVIPNCEVTLTVDNDDPIRIGFSSPKEAVASYLSSLGVPVDDLKDERSGIKIIEDKEGEVTLAYAVRWSEYFKEWSFYEVYNKEDETEPLLGTCVEGIRIEFNTPGYIGYGIVALSNATGVNAPKTNVARSGLEATRERDNMLSAIYSMLCKHINNEIRELHSRRSFSLTWAVQESKYLLSPLILSGRRAKPYSLNLLFEKVKDLPLLLLEKGGERHAVSPRSIQQNSVFWTIDCASFRSAEELIREVSGNASLSSLINILSEDSLIVPSEPLLCGTDPQNTQDALAYAGKEVIAIRVNREQRRVDLKWGDRATPSRWQQLPRNLNYGRTRGSVSFRDVRISELQSLSVGRGDIEVTGVSKDIAVRAFGHTYLLPDTSVAKLLLYWLDKANSRPRTQEAFLTARFMFMLVSTVLEGRFKLPLDLVTLRKFGASFELGTDEGIISSELVDTINSANWTVFDTSAWTRSSVEEEFDF